MSVIDLNSDLGEGLPPEIDFALLRIISSANIASGGHAGDSSSMRRTISEALVNNVRVGAHISYPDTELFGRIRVDLSDHELEESLSRQVEGLVEAAKSEGASVEYMKPHGALYNDAVAGYGNTVGALSEISTLYGLPVMTLPGSALERLGTCATIVEGFLDRAYRADGTLVPRSEPNALITHADGVRAQALSLAPGVQTLSLHSDTPGAVALMREARLALEESGYTIAAR